MATPRIGVVIVTYESDHVVHDLLASLAEHEPRARVVVVDDASPSGPPDVGDVDLLVQEQNAGYGTACNRGAAHLGDAVSHLAFLSPDVLLAGPSLTELARSMGKHPKVGLASGPLVDHEGNRIPSAFGPVSARRALLFAAGVDRTKLRGSAGTMVRGRVSASDASMLVDDMRVEGYVIGGTMLARRACFEEVGGFDEGYHLYWEDTDLCHRARDAGWRIRLLPCTPFRHAAAESSPVLSDEQRWTWFCEGATRYGSRHLVPGQARQLEAALRLGRRLGVARGTNRG